MKHFCNRIGEWSLRHGIDRRWGAATLWGTLITLVFDLLWEMQTTFRGMSFMGTYLNALLWGALLALPTLLCARRTRALRLQVAVWELWALLLVANLMYFRTYFSWIPPRSYLIAGNLKDFLPSVVDSLRLTDAILILLPLIFPLLGRRKAPAVPPVGGDSPVQPKGASASSSTTSPSLSGTSLGCRLGGAGVVVALSALLAWGYAQSNGGWKAHINWLAQGCYYGTQPPVIYTLAPVLASQMATAADTLTPEQRSEVEQWLAEQARRQAAYHPVPREERTNLVFILCESLESWVVGATVSGQEVTPCLNAMIADSTTIYCPNVVSQVANGRSIDAQLLMLAGLQPPFDEVYAWRFIDNRYHSLIEAMKLRNSNTRATLMTGDKPVVWNQQLVAERFGIDSLIAQHCYNNDELIGHPAKLSDESFMRQNIAKLGTVWPEGSPAYIQMVTYSGHNPFVLPDKLKRIRVTEEMPAQMADYITMANYTDHALGLMVNYLHQRSDRQHTMVVIVGDHEGLAGNRDSWRQTPAGRRLVDPDPHVPLLILNAPPTTNRRTPGRGDDTPVAAEATSSAATTNSIGQISQSGQIGPRTIAAELGEVDVYTTLLDLLGLYDLAPWKGVGFSAFDPLRPSYVFDSNRQAHPSSSIPSTSSSSTPAIAPSSDSHYDATREVSDKILRYNLLP
jgi:hypothetical protein